LLTTHESGWENIFASHIWTLIFPEQKTVPFNRNITLGDQKIEIFAAPHCKLNEKTTHTQEKY
jgi:hypothetical protein